MSHTRRIWRDQNQRSSPQNQRSSPETTSAGLAEADVLSHDGLDPQGIALRGRPIKACDPLLTRPSSNKRRIPVRLPRTLPRCLAPPQDL